MSVTTTSSVGVAPPPGATGDASPSFYADRSSDRWVTAGLTLCRRPVGPGSPGADQHRGREAIGAFIDRFLTTGLPGEVHEIP